MRFSINPLIIVAVTAVFPLNAMAESIVISGGAKGGTYQRWARNLGMLMKGLGHDVLINASGGSKDNVAAIRDKGASVGFTQADVLKAEGADGIEIIGSLGKECVFIAVAEDGKVDDEDDLQSEGPKIAVGSKGSGSQSTWDYMVSLESGYAKSAAQYAGGIRSLGKLKTGQLDAVMWVTAPGNLNHKMLSAVNADDALHLIDIDDSDLNDKLPDGSAVYTFEEIETNSSWGGGDIDTICTPVLAVADPDLPEDVLEDLAAQFVNNLSAVKQAP